MKEVKNCKLFEVGPRDGLQSEDKILSVKEKFELIKLLVATGVKNIEVASFVRPDWVPQMAGAAELFKLIKASRSKAFKSCAFWAFVPNDKGLDRALDAGVDGAGFFYASSKTFCKKNVNTEKKQLKKNLSQLLEKAREKKLAHRVYLSTSFHCPYEGETGFADLQADVGFLASQGVKDIVLSDTTGYAHPAMLQKFLKALTKKYNSKLFSLHLHDTRGMALANILQALSFGIQRFDASVAGAGGCPYAPGASGNVAMEDLIYMLTQMKKVNKLNLKAYVKAAKFLQKKLAKDFPSHQLNILG